MTTIENIHWDVCEQCAKDDGIGIRLPSGGNCWAHAEGPHLDAALKRLGEDGRLDARGVPISQELLERLLAATPKDDHGDRILTDAEFVEATFKGGGAGFQRVTFKGDTRFDRATFQDTVGFVQATFQDIAMFEGATFNSIAVFHWTTFERTANFSRATFRSLALFGGENFQTTHGFGRATFKGDALFIRATFQQGAWFGGTTFKGDAQFGGATFQQAGQLGPMLVRKSLLLDRAVFYERAPIEVAAAAVCCRRARFLAGVQLQVRWAQVVLDDADLVAPSILTVGQRVPELREERWARALSWLRAQRLNEPSERPLALALARRADSGLDDEYHHGSEAEPRLLSLRRADVAGLTVAHVDLRACQFAGAHHLDQLRIEGSPFGRTPGGTGYADRETIAEEHHWRRWWRGRRRWFSGRHWYHPAFRPPAWLEREPLKAAPLPADQIAGLYRALRKGREDNKDEPGAADFYYGEMEMRRLDSLRPRAERLVLWFYWALSGYGLRASRSVAWLLGVLVVATVALAAVGLERPAVASFPARLGTAVLVAVEGAVFRASEQELTYTGRLIQAVLRLVGPVLLGLAVLSVRGRVKR